jgi:hypothetical protein
MKYDCLTALVTTEEWLKYRKLIFYMMEDSPNDKLNQLIRSSDGVHGHRTHLPGIDASHSDRSCGVVEEEEVSILVCGHGRVDS